MRRLAAFDELVASYLLALRAANRRPRTIQSAQYRLVRLGHLVHGRPPARISPENVRLALVRVKSERRDGRARPISERYVHQHHAVWRGFFNWCIREGALRHSPMRNVPAPLVDEAELATFTRGEVRALLRTQDQRTFEGARNRLAIAVLYDTGLRVGELVRLELADLAGDGILVRHAKRRHSRRVPLSPRLARLVSAYVRRWRAPALFPELEPRLFTDRRGRPLQENGIRQWMRRAGRAAGISGVRCSPHTFRHTFATEYLLNGGTERGLMIIMGIRSRAVIDRYVHLVESRFAWVQHRRASPLAMLGRA